MVEAEKGGQKDRKRHRKASQGHKDTERGESKWKREGSGERNRGREGGGGCC